MKEKKKPPADKQAAEKRVRKPLNTNCEDVFRVLLDAQNECNNFNRSIERAVLDAVWGISLAIPKATAEEIVELSKEMRAWCVLLDRENKKGKKRRYRILVRAVR